MSIFAIKSSYHTALYSIVTLFVSVFAIAFIIPAIIDSLVNESIDEQVIIDSTNAPNYQSWQTNVEGPGEEIQIMYDVYYFDLQNPVGVLNGQKPALIELGPYAFNEYFNKFDITWSNDGDVVTYYTQKYYIFNQGRSGPGLTEFDNITVPYPVVIAFQYYLSLIPVSTTELVNAQLDAGIFNEYSAIETALDDASKAKKCPNRNEVQFCAAIRVLEREVTFLYQNISAFVNDSIPSDLLLKTLLCPAPSGISPFWVTNPLPGYFGWFNDPVLTEVQKIINLVTAKNASLVIPWTTAVPGASSNWTSPADVKRRMAPDTLRTGKVNTKNVAAYVRYNNMTEEWTCISPMNSQNTSQYIEGKEFPACAIFQHDWTDEEARAAGYTKPFATNFANRVEGNDGNMYGRPVTTNTIETFISDIYRAVFLVYSEDVDWHGVPLRRYVISNKDLQNATVNPDNGQFYSFSPSGMLNATAAVNIPCFISFPHFLDGDASLVAAFKGLNPSADRHSSYLDIEPQTGLLARAQKKLQVNYQMKSKELPTLPPYIIHKFHTVCDGLNSFIANCSDLSCGINASEYYSLANVTQSLCNDSSVTWSYLSCMATPSSWNLNNDIIYFPYSWVSEYFSLSQSDAESLQSSLLDVITFSQQFQFWCLIVSGILFASAVCMVITKDFLLTSKIGDVAPHEVVVNNPFQTSRRSIDYRLNNSSIDNPSRAGIRSPLLSPERDYSYVHVTDPDENFEASGSKDSQDEKNPSFEDNY